MARVITAQRDGSCRAMDCRAATREIAAGERINYGGFGAVTHEGCPALDAPRKRRRASGYTSWDRRGRCIDAPCCGCCD